MNVRLRLGAFALVGVLLATLVGWAGRSAWQQLRQLQTNFAAVQAGSFHLAEHVEAALLNLNEIILRAEGRQDGQTLKAFQEQGAKLKTWLATQRAAVGSPHERDLLAEIEVAYGTYEARTLRVLQEWSPTASPLPARQVLQGVEADAMPVAALCARLKGAERTALTEFMKDSHQAMVGLQHLVEVSGVLIVLLGLTVTTSIYRAKVAPLRAQLVQTRAIIERQEKLASLGTLAAGVAHEIRNPLTAINVRLHSLKRTLADGSSEHEDAVVIDEEIHRLERIVRGFLHFARPPEPELVSLAPAALLNKVRGLLAPQLEKAAIQLDLSLGPEVRVRADPNQMEQVLINLIQNGAESMAGPGRIELAVRVTTARLGGRLTPAVVLEVADQGKGIPPEVQARLFDPFFTTKEDGTGLGLSVAARIVEKHGGALQYKTEVGRGTTFGIVLPRLVEDSDED